MEMENAADIEAKQKAKEANRRKVKFFKYGIAWYADVPNHTMAENQMVAGADTLLDAVANGGTEVTADVAWPEYGRKDWLVRLDRTNHNQHGATYDVTAAPSIAPFAKGMPKTAWICNVTHDVLGEHPDTIYIVSLKAA